MQDHTTNSVGGKTHRDLRLRALRAIGSKIFAAEDLQACDLGWEITRSRCGLRRSYRDPRFNYLTACTACDGKGCDSSGVTCIDCDGAGRIKLDATDSSQPGEGRQ